MKHPQFPNGRPGGVPTNAQMRHLIQSRFGSAAVVGWLLLQNSGYRRPLVTAVAFLMGGAWLARLGQSPSDAMMHMMQEGLDIAGDVLDTGLNLEVGHIVNNMRDAPNYIEPSNSPETIGDSSPSDMKSPTTSSVISQIVGNAVGSYASSIIQGECEGSIRGSFKSLNAQKSKSDFTFKGARPPNFKKKLWRGVKFDKQESPEQVIHIDLDNYGPAGVELGRTGWLVLPSIEYNIESYVDDYKNALLSNAPNVLDYTILSADIDVVMQKWIKVESNFMNGGVHPLEMWLYDFVCAQDVYDTALTYSDMTSYFTNTYDRSNFTTAAAANESRYLDPDASLKNNHIWNKFFAVKNTTFIRLMPGQLHTHTTFFRNNLCDSQIAQTVNGTMSVESANIQGVAGRTCGLLLRVRGELATLTAAGATAAGAGTAEGQLVRGGGLLSYNQDVWTKIVAGKLMKEKSTREVKSAITTYTIAGSRPADLAARLTQDDVVYELGTTTFPSEAAQDT